jgi:hypothetical protein
MSEQIPKNTSSYVNEDGKFKKGNIGKPKGATNKNTRDLKNFITSFLNEKSSEIPDMWDELETKDKLTLFMHLCRLVMPKAIEEESSPNNELKQPIWMIVDNSQKVEPITGMQIIDSHAPQTTKE